MGCVLGADVAGAGALPDDDGAAALAPKSHGCAPWPDEPDPLPDVTSPDPILAHWARQRAARLADEALALESRAPGQADRLWARVRCLDPSLPALVRNTALPGPVGGDRTSLPDVAAQPPELAGDDVTASGPPIDGWPLLLAAPGAPAADEETAARPAEPDLTDVDQELGELDVMVEEAQFRTALSVAEATRTLLEQAGDSPAARVRRVRLEVLCATAAIALGREDEARAYMMTALENGPDLQLDAATTSPKVMALLGEARAAALGDGAGGNLP